MNKLMTLLSAISVAVMLSGCATTIDLAKFRDADMKEAEIMPTRAQLSCQRIKIVVFEADESALGNVRGAGLGLALSNTVEKELSVSGAEIVDRSLAMKLGDELKLAESKGTGNYQGPEVAQFAIRGKVLSAEYGAKYNEASSYTDKKGKTHYTPASYSHTANVSGGIRIYELPNLRLIASVNLNGNSSYSDPRQGADQQIGAKLLRTATESAIQGSSHEIKNLFAPKGYVVEKRADGEKSIFKILMGREQGVKPEDKVVIYSVRKKINALTGVEQIDEIPVAEATVSDQVTSNESWIIPANKEAAALVRLGDFVKVKYAKASIFGQVLKIAQQ